MKVRNLAVRHVRSRRPASFVPMTVHQARRLEPSDPISVLDGMGRRCVGVVIAPPRRGKGKMTSVRVAYRSYTGCVETETIASAGMRMTRLLAPDTREQYLEWNERLNEYTPSRTGEAHLDF